MPHLLKRSRIYRKSRNKITKKKTFLFVFVCIILISLILVNFADMFSSLITSRGSLFSVTKIETASYSIYGVSIKDFPEETSALNYSSEIKKIGAAGFIYHSGEYFVLGNAYPTLNEANEIKENLQQLNYNSRIVKITVQNVSKTYRGSNLQLLQTCLNFFRNCYNSLYETNINFDKNILSKSQTNGIVAGLLTELVNLNTSLTALKQNADNEIKNIISPYFSSCREILETLLYSNSENTFYSSLMKQTSIKIVLENVALVKVLNAA